MEITASALQTVAAGQNVLFTDTPISGSKCITHREGSGLINLRGITNNQSKARFLATFSANIAVPTGGTVGEIAIALAIDGEPLQSAVARVTPAAVEEFFNVSVQAFVEVPRCCCETISIENISATPISVQNASLIATREA